MNAVIRRIADKRRILPTIICGLALASFCLLFLAFEVMHPAAELVHLGQFHCDSSGSAPVSGAHSGEEPVNVHGPIAGQSIPTIVPCESLYFRPLPFSHGVEQTYLDPPSPVPILT